MARNRLIVLIYIGILYCFQNVLADDLNLENILFSGFSVSNTSKDSCTYTEVAPKPDKGITKVLDGEQVLWEADGTTMCIGVMLITRSNYQETLMYIEFLKSRNYTVKYFTKNDGVYTENDEETFASKLANMSDSSSSEDLGYGSGRTSEESVENIADYQQQEEETLDYEVEYDDQEETPENVVTGFEDKEVFLNRKGKSLRKVTEYQCDADDRECCNQKRILDIMKPEDNKRVRYDYEINDGVPTVTITSKKRKKVTMVYEDQYNIWSSNGDEKLVLLSAHSFYGEYRLVELFYSKDKTNYNVFFNKINNKWQQVNDDDFVAYYKSLKSKIRHVGDIALNVSNVKNADLFYEKYEQNETYKATTYFPLTGYHLTQVGDGNKLIWSSDKKRCISAVVITEDKFIRFLRLEILSGEDTTFNKFYKKEDNKYVKISEDDFEQYINNEKPVSFGSPIPVNEVEPPHEAEHKDTDMQTEQSSQDEYEPENINLDNFKIEYVVEQSPKETLDQFAGTEVEYDGFVPTELDLNDLNPHSVSKGEYKNVKYKSIFPQDGYVFNLFKEGDNLIWRGNSDKYCDFVRMFYHEKEPKLGFMRLNENGNEEDKYFVEDSGIWKFVSHENFKLVFGIYAEYEATKLASQESTKSVYLETEQPDEDERDSTDTHQEDVSQSKGPYRGRQPNKNEENSPLAFFVFDINDEDEPLQS